MDRLAERAPVIAPDAMVPRIARVVRRARELPDTWTLDLVAADGGPLMRYAPGQFTMMYVFGVGEIPVSISGDASDATRLVQTVRAVGKVSEAVTKLAAGDTLGLRGPVRLCLAGGGWLRSRRRGGGRRPWAGAAASGALPASGGAPAVRQAGVTVWHAPAGGHPVPAADRELAATARYGDRGHRRSRQHRLARPCRRGHQADPASRHRCRERDGAGVRAGGDDAVCGQRAAGHRPRRKRRSISRWSAT